MRSCAESLDGGGWNVVGRGSGMRGSCGTVGIGVGVDVWEGSVGVGVGLAILCCVGGADTDFVGVSSVMMSIGVGSVSGRGRRGRKPVLK